MAILVLWKDEELELLEALRPAMNNREIRQVLSALGYERSIEAVAKKSRSLGVKFIDFGVPAPVGLSQEARDAIDDVLALRDEQFSTVSPPNILSSAEKAAATTKRRSFIRDLSASLKEMRNETPRTSSVSTKKATGDKESLVIVLSDNHIGRTFHDPNTHNEIYNMEIGLSRLKSTPDKILDLLTPDQKNNIDEVVLLLIGDHVDGEGIFPGQELHLEEHAAEQVKQTTKGFWEVIKKIRANFPLVRVITTKGNHGRAGLSAESNWDNMLFQQLELLVDLEEDPNLTIKNRYGDYNTCEIKGWKGLLRHKASPHADSPSGIAKFAGWYGIHQWDFVAYGHFHHWGVMTWNGKPIFRNGSMMGGDDYAEGFGAYDNPNQLCFTVSEKSLPVSIYPIKY